MTFRASCWTNSILFDVYCDDRHVTRGKYRQIMEGKEEAMTVRACKIDWNEVEIGVGGVGRPGHGGRNGRG